LSDRYCFSAKQAALRPTDPTLARPQRSFGRRPVPEIPHHRHRDRVPLIGQFFRDLGKFKRNAVAFLDADVVGRCFFELFKKLDETCSSTTGHLATAIALGCRDHRTKRLILSVRQGLSAKSLMLHLLPPMVSSWFCQFR
jgi:hypothetical protein